jgi:hypothetical protein
MLPIERTQTYFITNNPIRVDPLTAESVTIITKNGMNDKIFKVRSPMGRFCDISEIIFGMTFITIKVKCKNSE